GNPTVVTASGNELTARAISRDAAAAARPAIVHQADIGPRAALGEFASRFVFGGARREEPRDWFLKIADLSSGETRETTLATAVGSITMSPGGGYAAVTDPDGRNDIIALPTFETVRRIPAGERQDSPTIVAFSPDDRFVAWGSTQRGIQLLDLRTGSTRPVATDVAGLSAIAVAPGASAVAGTQVAVDPDCRCVSIRVLAADGKSQSLGTLQAREAGSQAQLKFDR